MTRNWPHSSVSLEQLHTSTSALKQGATPVGSVDFLRKAMGLVGIKLPAALNYPKRLQKWLHREITPRRKGDLPATGEWFIKPAISTKTFKGGVYSMEEVKFIDQLTSEHADAPTSALQSRNDLELIRKLPREFPVWVASPISWQSEWRFYIHRGMIKGAARYDKGLDSAPEPEINAVRLMINDLAFDAPIAYALDIGVLENGKTALVTVNDAWALAYYPGSLAPETYLDMLRDRWIQLIKPGHVTLF
ncbi:MAG: ATP-grasp domain-containing protein [Pusillimonas sp.]